MKLVFKPSATLSSPENGVTVGDTNFKEHYPEIQRNMAWETLTPRIRQATRKYVIPFIGQEIYNDIAEEYQEGNELTESQEEFLQFLQDAIALYTIHLALPYLNMTVADIGVSEATGGNSLPVSQWRFNRSAWANIANADQVMDSMLEFMEARVAANDDYFDLWKESVSYKKMTSALFRFTRDLQEQLNIHNSRRTFLALLPHLRRTEKTIVKDLISTEVVDELSSQLFDGSLTEANEKLLDKVRAVVAHHALYLAIPHLSVMIEGDGIKVTSATDSMEAKGNVLSSFGKEAVERLIQRAKEDADIASKELLNFLYLFESDYQTWLSSSAHIQKNNLDGCDHDAPSHSGGVIF